MTQGLKQQPWIKHNNMIMQKTPDGRLQLDQDKLAVKSFFIDKINMSIRYFEDLEEKMRYLIDNEYYIDFYQYYTHEEIKQVHVYVYSKKFRFASYMAASKFYQTYALRDDNNKDLFLEKYEDRIAAVALFLAREEGVERALAYAEIMITQEYQPATPTFLNAGKKRAGELVSCFLDEIGDSLNGIGYAVNSAMHLSSIGGGVAFNISKVRARGEAIKGVKGRAGGVLPIMKIMEDTFSYANQLGTRPGAGALYLNIFHSDIEEFLDCKKINVDEKIRIKSLSIGVILPDKFFELAALDHPYFVFGPHSVYTEYGKYLDDLDMNEYYSKLVDNPNIIKRKLNARGILTKIAQTQKESGYPYIFLKGNANNMHALNNVGDVTFSNLCTEIMQVSQVSEIGDFFDPSEFRYGISCNLGSLNIATVMDNKRVKEAVALGIRSLTTVTDVTDIKKVPSISKANRELHAVGLGAMNLHGYLIKKEIMYDSAEGVEFADRFFEMMNYYSLVESNKIAIERKQSFVGFEKSMYGTGEYFDKYLQNVYGSTDVRFFKSKDVENLFEGMELPTREDWNRLKESVKHHGLYHAYRLAIAPNQSTSYIMNATASVMPIVDPIEAREYGDSTTYYPMPYLTNENIFFYKSAYDMDQIDVLRMVGAIQRHVDQGVSCILHTKSEHSTRDLVRFYLAANQLGLKSLYYTRTRKSSIEDCVSCSA